MAVVCLASAQTSPAPFSPQIPTAWVDSEIADLEIPLAKTGFSPKHVSADFDPKKPIGARRANWCLKTPTVRFP